MATVAAAGLMWIGHTAAPALLAAPESQAPAPSADTLLSAAQSKAKAEGKRVFVEFGASWCAPCRRLEALFDAPDIKPVIEAHFVVLRITVWENKDKAELNNSGGEALMDRWGSRGGIPFYAILDERGDILSAANGYPGSADEIHAFLSLLERTAPRMTEADRSVVASYLDRNSNPFGSIAGRVMDARGNPAVGVGVSPMVRAFIDGQWRYVPHERRVVTDNNGWYSIDRIDPGEYRIVAEAGGASVPFVLQRNQDRSAVDLATVAPSLSHIVGRVVRANGQPGAWSIVTAAQTDRPWAVLSATVGGDGTFALRNVPAGSYELWVRSEPEPGGANREIGHESVVVSDSDVREVVIHTRSGATLAGQVITHGAEVPASARGAIRVVAVPVDLAVGAPRERHQSAVGPAGGVEMRGLWGRRVIRVENLPPGWILDRVQAGGREVTDQGIDFDAVGAVNDAVITITDQSFVVAGTAKDAQGATIRDGVIVVFSTDSARWTYPSRFVKSVPVDEGGAYRSSALPMGEYWVAWLPALPRSWDAPAALTKLQKSAQIVRAVPFTTQTSHIRHPAHTRHR